MAAARVKRVAADLYGKAEPPHRHAGAYDGSMSFDLEPGSFRGLIFDCDGTLVETLPAHARALQDVLRPFGLTASEEWCRSKYGQPNTVVMQAFAREIAPLPMQPRDFLQEWVQAYSRNLHLLEEIPETCDTARAWHGRVPMAVASNGRGANVRATLKALDLLPLFDAVVSVEEVLHGKPEPDLFLEAARRIGIAPANCVVFEDSDEGLEAARRAGMRTILVASRYVPARA